MLVVGAFAMTLLAGAPRWPTARAWQASVLMRARALLLMAIVFGLASLGWQTAVLEGRASAALDPAALLRVLLETQAGHVWLARHGLLILLAAWVALVPERDDETDWLAARGQAATLGVAALVLLGAAGHAAAVEPGTFGAPRRRRGARRVGYPRRSACRLRACARRRARRPRGGAARAGARGGGVAGCAEQD